MPGNKPGSLWERFKSKLDFAANTIQIITFIIPSITISSIVIVWAKGSTKIWAITTSVLSIVLLIAQVWQHHNYKKKSRNPEPLKSLRQVFTRIPSLSLNSASYKDNPAAAIEIIETKCELVINRVAKLMTEITGKACSACIKIVTYGEIDGEQCPKAVTLCRDDSSEDREDIVDSEHNNHWIGRDENTAFDVLCFPKKPKGRKNWFFSNNLPSMGDDYKSSNRTLYTHAHPEKKDWPFPFKSAIVCPIKRSSTDEQQGLDVIGFIYVDCDVTDVFDKQRDIPLLTDIAKLLGTVIEQYQHFSEPNSTQLHSTDSKQIEKKEVYR